MLRKMFRLVLGQKLDPPNPQTRHGIVLVAFLALNHLGADGFSSACFGPAEAFLPPGPHPHLALYLTVCPAGAGFAGPLSPHHG